MEIESIEEEEHKSILLKILVILFALFAIFLLVLYSIPSFSFRELTVLNSQEDFVNLNSSTTPQFYLNMRYPNSNISYRVNDCPVKKKEDARDAFDILSNLTDLNFYSVLENEEITVSCDDTLKTEGGLFIAGEGGPTNITVSGNFNVIRAGRILLIKDSECPKPNVAIHEILHALGFTHSNNSWNIMYNVSKCSQEIGEETIKKINELYSIESLPNLEFEDVDGNIDGRTLTLTFGVRNNGLARAEKFVVEIYNAEDLVETINSDSLGIGEGVKISLVKTIYSFSLEDIRLEIVSNQNELSKEDNSLILG